MRPEFESGLYSKESFLAHFWGAFIQKWSLLVQVWYWILSDPLWNSTTIITIQDKITYEEKTKDPILANNLEKNEDNLLDQFEQEFMEYEGNVNLEHETNEERSEQVSQTFSSKFHY